MPQYWGSEVLLDITLYVIFMFRSVYNSQQRQKITAMKRYLLFRKTRIKQSPKSCFFFKGRGVRKCLYFSILIWKNNLFFLHVCRKVYLAKDFDISSLKSIIVWKQFSLQMICYQRIANWTKRHYVTLQSDYQDV